jgi:hypothetical protein
MTAKQSFVRQQGFRDATADACAYQFPALMWQPRIIGILVLIGLVMQAWLYFLGLGVLLWWNALLPRFNPFDHLHNAVARGGTRLGPAPGPRRFAQGMAGTFMLAIALTLLGGWRAGAWIVEGLLLTALAALIFGRFCLGSYIFLLVTGQAKYANRTLPWSRS